MAFVAAPAHALRGAMDKFTLRRLWDRKLAHYPASGPRSFYLGLTVLATVVLYYELYLQGAVGTQLISQYGFTFKQFVYVSMFGGLAGAFASLFAGLADRWGRANLVVAGLLINGCLIAYAVPHAPNRLTFTLALVVVSFVEGMALVATPALIRDFSPQVGRGAAMGLWTMGPVLGSLAVTEISSHTLDAHPAWQWQYQLCGGIGLIVGLIALFGLRELSPALRDQLMVSEKDRALVEARAAGLDEKQALEGHWRQMLRFDIVGPAISIGLFLMTYFMLVGFLVIYFSSTFGYSAAEANSLGNWFWITEAIALLAAGLLSDKLRVRKPFIVVGALVSIVGVALFAIAATHPDTSRGSFIAYFVVMAAGMGIAYAAWMAAFTESIEKRNPAATATGLAVWGYTVRIMLTVFLALLPLAVRATTTLVDKGVRVQAIAAKYPTQVGVLKAVDPATLTALQKNPDDTAAQTRALAQLTSLPAKDVAAIAKNGPKAQAAGDRLASLSKVPAADLAFLSAHGARVNAILAQYPAQVGVLQRVDASTMAALSANAADTAAQARAVSQLSGLPVPTVASVIANGTAVQAAGDRLKSVSTIPPADLDELSKYGTRVNGILAKYPAQVRILQTVDSSTMTALSKNPDDTAAQARAVSQLSGLPTSTVARVIRLSTTDKAQLATAQAIDPATLSTLSKNMTDSAAIAKALAEVAKKFGISSAAATQRLVALSSVPQADLELLQGSGPKVQAAATRLQSVNAIPKADLDVLATHGPRVQSVVTRYPAQVKVLQSVDVATMTALNANANDTAAQARALSQLTGLPNQTVAAALTSGTAVQAAAGQLQSVSTIPAADLDALSKYAPRLQKIVARYPKQVAVIKTVDPATLNALDKNAKDIGAQAAAVAQLTGLSRTTTTKILAHGTKVQHAGDLLKSLAKLPAADSAYLAAYAGPVTAAAKLGPHQWQRWWWICLLGQIVFIPFVFVLKGRWSPRKAREDEREHVLEVARELEELRARAGAKGELLDPGAYGI